MNKKQWFRRFEKALSSLPRAERAEAAQYYRELYEDRLESGETEEAIVATFGLPEQAAAEILRDKGEGAARPAASDAAVTFGRAVAVIFLFICVGLPVLACVFAVAVAAGALSISGFALALGGVAQTACFLTLFFLRGFPFGFLAQTGLGVALAGAGLLLIPLFLFCAGHLFRFCLKFLKATMRLIRDKRSA